MAIALIGFTSCGKSAAARGVAMRLNWPVLDLDAEIERLGQERFGEHLSCRALFQTHGAECFRELETAALAALIGTDDLVLATGGGAPLREENQKLLKTLGTICYIQSPAKTIMKRMSRKGLPAYLGPNPTFADLERVWHERHPVYLQLADCVVDNSKLTIAQTADSIVAAVGLGGAYEQ